MNKPKKIKIRWSAYHARRERDDCLRQIEAVWDADRGSLPSIIRATGRVLPPGYRWG